MNCEKFEYMDFCFGNDRYVFRSFHNCSEICFQFCVHVPFLYRNPSDLVLPLISQYVSYVHHTSLMSVGVYDVFGTFVEDFC